MIKILHFADAHIDIAGHGRHDALTGLPLRALDFLKALDAIVKTAVSEKVDLVIFAGDAYKDRTPSPTYQREWGKRIARLSAAKIPTLLLTGNHDVSPAAGRAHTMQEFDTLDVPFVRVIDKPEFLKHDQLWNLPLQVIALPWIFRSGLMSTLLSQDVSIEDVNEEIGKRVITIVQEWLENLDPQLPTVLVAHATIQGATFGNERSVMLGKDVVLPGGLVKDPRLDYSALGHIHKYQNLNEGAHPPVIYPGSIERVGFGETADEKGFVIASVEKGKTTVERRLLSGRPFFNLTVKTKDKDTLMSDILKALPTKDLLNGAMLRLEVEYPRAVELFLDETTLREHCAQAFEFHLVRRPLEEARTRFSQDDDSVANLNPLELLERYWKMTSTNLTETKSLRNLAASIIQNVSGMNDVAAQENEDA